MIFFSKQQDRAKAGPATNEVISKNVKLEVQGSKQNLISFNLSMIYGY